jgi:hypothetical protein
MEPAGPPPMIAMDRTSTLSKAEDNMFENSYLL